MFDRRRYLLKALVWVMLPVTLAAGLPKMHCRCAHAKGLMWCVCCVTANKSAAKHNTALRSCCQHRTAKSDAADKNIQGNKADQVDCLACRQGADRRPSNCCRWSAGVVTTLVESASSAPSADLGIAWIAVDDSPLLSVTTGPRDFAQIVCPQFDRLTVFQHLVI